MPYSVPNMSIPGDRIAHLLSELHNDNAPMGWEQYKGVALGLFDHYPCLRDQVRKECGLDES